MTRSFWLPHLLSKEDLASQARRYVESYNVNMITSAKIQSTEYDPVAERWTVHFLTPAGNRTAISKHIVLATGIGSQKCNIPQIAGSDLYKGISIHSAQYKNAEQRRKEGAKVGGAAGHLKFSTQHEAKLMLSNLVSLNHFDILEDCHAAGL